MNATPEHLGMRTPATGATQAQLRKLYETRPSFVDVLPWAEYLPEQQAFILVDGRSVGAFFELRPVATDGQGPEFLASLAKSFQDVITETLPEDEQDPWVLQLFVQDDPNLQGFMNEFRSSVREDLRTSPFTQDYVNRLAAHLERISAPAGLFEDRNTGGRWRGRRRRIRACLYRRLGGTGEGQEPLAELADVCVRLTTALTAAGVMVKRGTGKMFYDWLLPWFNPCPALTEGDPIALLNAMPYPGDDELPFGADFAQSLFLTPPRSDDQGLWWFDDRPQTCVTLQGLRRAPHPGHYTAELSTGAQSAALFDQMPEGTVLTLTIIFKAQYHVLNHIAHIVRASIGETAESKLTRETGELAQRAMAEGDKIYPLIQACYVTAPDKLRLQERLHRLNTLLVTHGIQPIARHHDLLTLDSYVRYLPFNYEPHLDKVRRRGRLTFSTHIANLLPFYGRSIGTGRPGMVFFNRAGEPVTFDPLNRQDRKKNAHFLILGPTGSGKSATVNGMLLHALAVHRPRIFIIDAGHSFDLFGDYCRSHGLSVHQVVLDATEEVSLPPFAGALRLLEQPLTAATDFVPNDHDDLEPVDVEEEQDEPSDPLGQMELAARIMVTGGEDDALHRISRSARLLLRKAILQAAKSVKTEGRSQVLTEDVAHALRTLPDLEPHRRAEAEEMAGGLDLFCTGIQGRFFNRPGTPWPTVDVTILELGLFVREGYEDSLAVAYTSIMSHIQDFAERHQRDGRATIVVNDEAHLITVHPLLAPYTAKAIRLWRKFGTWYWAITHSLEDYPDLARRMLNMMEWWLCLAMETDEVEQVARFRTLTPGQKTLLLSARKEPGKYTEGAALGAHFQALLRIIPPPLALALAMTEPEEKAERARIQRERNCSELEAALVIAERLAGPQP